MAAKGYTCIRPDMRGHGDSEGIMFDEYSPREQKDAVEVIDWIANQKWCSGNVGMMGLSWGGIASMQAAIKQPNALKAIIPVGVLVAADQLSHKTILPAKATHHIPNNIEKGEIVYEVKIDGRKTKFKTINSTYR